MRVLLWGLTIPLWAAMVPRAAAAQQPDSSRRPTAATAPVQSAGDPRAVQPERPTVATHAGIVATGFVEIEAGVERDRVDPNAISVLTPTVVKIGVGRHGQLNLFGSLARPAAATLGVGDLGVGVKWRLADDAPIIGDFAVLPSIKLPTGSASAGRGTGTTDLSLLAISSHDVGGVAMDLNVGYTRRSGDGSVVPRNATLWTASFGGSARGRLGWVAECYGYPATRGPGGQASIVALLAGPTFLMRPWLAFDTGLIIPMTGPQPHALYAGAVYNAGRLWRG